MEPPVLVSYLGGDKSVCVVTLNRPKNLNSLNPPLVAELAAAFAMLRGEKELKCVILTGAGRAFSAGVDLSDPPNAVEQASDDPAHLANNPTYQMSLLPVPIIGAINGYAITGGMEIALACDILIGSTEAVFKDTHVKFGLAPCWGLSQRLAKLVGPSRAQYMSYTAAALPGKKAYEWGMLVAVTEPESLMAAAEKIACQISSNDQDMVIKYKSVLQAGLRSTHAEGLRNERSKGLEHYKGMDLGGGVAGWKSKL